MVESSKTSASKRARNSSGSPEAPPRDKRKQTTRKSILVFPSPGDATFDQSYPLLSQHLKEGASVNHAADNEALQLILEKGPIPDILLIINSGWITRGTFWAEAESHGANKLILSFMGPNASHVRENSEQIHPPLNALKDYAKNERGIIVFLGDFIKSVEQIDLDWLLREVFSLSWKQASTKKAELELNQATAEKFDLDKDLLAQKLTGEAVFVKGMDNSAALYTPPGDSEGDVVETAVALEQVGRGWVGYIGSKDITEDSVRIALAMCWVN